MEEKKVLDSWPLVALFEGQRGEAEVTKLLKEAAEKNDPLLISAVNWGEVLYTIEIRYGKSRRDVIEDLMEKMKLRVVDVDRNLVREAANLKARYKLPYADCFAGALALVEKAQLVTGDKDFSRLRDEISILWL